MKADQKKRKGKLSKEEKIKEIREKLDWYTFEASEEEFDEEEVDWLVQRLCRLEETDVTPGQEPGSDFARFKEYLMEKREDAIRCGAGAVGKRAESIVTGEKASGKKRTGTWRIPAVAAAAAVLVVAVLAGGTMGVTNAEKEGGIFNLIRKDENGEKWVILPQKEKFTLEDDKQENSDGKEELLKEYQDDIIAVETMDSLADYELKEVEVREYSAYVEISYRMSKGTEEILITDCVYKNSQIVVKEETFERDTYQGTEEVEGLSLDIFSKEDSDQELDIAVGFWVDNHQCRISGKNDSEQLKKIAVEYARMVEQIQ